MTPRNLTWAILVGLAAGGLLLLAAVLAPAFAPAARPAALSNAPTAVPFAQRSGSLDRIAAAEQQGALDHTTALLYQLAAAYNPASVPAAYQAVRPAGAQVMPGDATASTKLIPGAAGHDATGLLADLTRHWSQLGHTLQAQIQPFRDRPSAPQSFWAQQAGGQLLSGTTHTFAYVDSPQTPTRIWYVVERGEDEKTLATELANEIDISGVWTKERSAMLGHVPCSDANLPDNGGNGRLDLYLVRPGGSIHRNDSHGTRGQLPGASSDYELYGLTVSQAESDSCASTVFILLNDTLSFDDLRNTAAHEMFHAFQGSFQETDEDWWDEATATWAEDYIYPTLNTEQSQLEAGGWANKAGPLGPLDRYDDNGEAQYGAYIWPYYLTHRPGGTPQLIGQIDLAAQTKPLIQVLHDMPDWAARFKEFALWDWNRAPVDIYRDNGAHIDALTQTPRHLGSRGSVSLPAASYDTNVNVPRASIGYYELAQVNDSARAGGFVHQLRFDLSGITGQAGAGVQAIITVGDPAHPTRQYTEDWSALPAKTFCRDRAAEAVSDVVLVVSNSSIADHSSVSGVVTVDTADACR